ncbi:LRR receptor-like serine/threonine-protein kinase FLS2 [Musa acuminata AAA Group]|uniref:LRR receptor-like serine/threonine-protein kinase FLS2 n=1 Tax=Musa acuminata AAA Group TaxID=214697 RepID=UPI0031D45CEA
MDNMQPLCLVFLFLCSTLLLQWSQGCHPHDRSALLTFKAGITADPSGLLRSWDSATDCCSAWDGVACDAATGRVVNVSRPGLSFGPDFISDASIAGSLSPALGDLFSLRREVIHIQHGGFFLRDFLDCLEEILSASQLLRDFLNCLEEILSAYHNQLTGCIPSANLTRLRKLSLGNNRLSGSLPSLPPSMFTSPFLSVVSLSNNRLTGGIPASIGRVPAMEALDLHGNHLTGSIPMEIGLLRRLTVLDLSENKISGGIPSSIGKLKNLVVLYLNQNRITGSIPPSIAGMVSLQFCRMSENQLTGSIPDSIGGLPSIERLILENNKLTGQLPAAIGRLATLTDIFFSNNRFTGRIPSSFANLANLQTLDLSRNRLGGPIPAELSRLRNLQELDLSFNSLMHLGRPPSWLGQMNIFKLVLADTGISGPLSDWLSSASSISILDLSSNGLVGDLPPWIGNMTGLSLLNLSNNTLHSGIPEGFKNLTLLMDLDLHSNELYGRLRLVLAKGTQDPLGHYRTLDLSRNRFTGGLDEGVGELAAMDTVERLVVSHNPELGGGIPASMARLAALKEVGMAGNGLSGSIPEGVLDLARLTEFDVSDNRLSGRIPRHRAPLTAEGFRGNTGLCSAPLPPCKLW